MGYFSNGSEGDRYEAQYCNHCVHRGDPDGPGCAVLQAHLLHNYKECNKEDSILHLLIPRSKDKLTNEKCRMFVRGNPEGLEKHDRKRMTPEVAAWAEQRGLI